MKTDKQKRTCPRCGKLIQFTRTYDPPGVPLTKVVSVTDAYVAHKCVGEK